MRSTTVRQLRHLTSMAVALSLASCGGGETGTGPSTDVDPKHALATITVSPATASIEITRTVPLTAEARNGYGNRMTVDITWTSSDPSIATVDGSGLVTGVDEGLATITARSGSVSGVAAVQVVLPPPPTAPSDVTAEVASPTDVDVSWADNSTTETEFVIERQVVSAAEGPEAASSAFEEAGRVGANTRSFRDSGVSASTTYLYRVSACHDYGCSEPTTAAEEVETPEDLAIVTESLPEGIATVPYEFALTASGPVEGLEWSLIEGELPYQMALSQQGVIVGTTPWADSVVVTVQVVNSTGRTATAKLTLIIRGKLSIGPARLRGSTPGAPYHEELSTGGGRPPFVFTITGGELPPGLSLSPAGVVSGTPTTLGTYTVIVTVTSDDAQTATGVWDIRIVVATDHMSGLIHEAMTNWWQANHMGNPGMAMSVMADDHSTSLINWGMLDLSSEPRQAFNNDPGYPYNDVAEWPWDRLHQGLLNAAHTLYLVDLDDGAELSDSEAALYRTAAKLAQGLSLGTLAQTFDQALPVTESSLPALIAGFTTYEDLLDMAVQSLTEAADLAIQEGVTLPYNWVGENGDWTPEFTAAICHAFIARFMASVPRTVEDREGVDWGALLGHLDQATAMTGWEVRDRNLWHSYDKRYGASDPAWARLDYRTVGPADASGAYQAWVAAPLEERTPFLIDTDDLRITNGDPTSDGLYVRHKLEHDMPTDRGPYHLSFYLDRRWAYRLSGGDPVPDYPVKEMDLLRAEALYRTGDPAGAMTIVNQYRAVGSLPPFTDPAGVAPGDGRCVPKMEDGSCGDLWEALKYEKRIEVFHYGFGTAYFDDRGWGDLVENTMRHFPVPGYVLLELGLPIYTYGGDQPDMAPPLLSPSPDAVSAWLRRLMEQRSEGGPYNPSQ